MMLSQNCLTVVGQTSVSSRVPSTRVTTNESYHSTTSSTACAANYFQPPPQTCSEDLVITSSTSTSLASPIDETEEFFISCLCGDHQDDGLTILCSGCSTWQHVACTYPGSAALVSRPEFVHFCVPCSRDLVVSEDITADSSLDHTNRRILGGKEITEADLLIEKLFDRRMQIPKSIPQDPDDLGGKLNEKEETLHYCVKWLGFGYGKCTWEPPEFLPSDMVASFEEVCSRGERRRTETATKRSRPECDEIEEDFGGTIDLEYRKIEADADEKSGSEYSEIEDNAGDSSGSEYDEIEENEDDAGNNSGSGHDEIEEDGGFNSGSEYGDSIPSKKRKKHQTSQPQRAGSKTAVLQIKKPNLPRRHKMNWLSPRTPFDRSEDPDLVIWLKSGHGLDEITRKLTWKGVGAASEKFEHDRSPEGRQRDEEEDEIVDDTWDAALSEVFSSPPLTPVSRASSPIKPASRITESDMVLPMAQECLGDRSRSNPMFMTPDVDRETSPEIEFNGSDDADVFLSEDQSSQEFCTSASNFVLGTYNAPNMRGITDCATKRLRSLASNAHSFHPPAPLVFSRTKFRHCNAMRSSGDDICGRIETTNVRNAVIGTSNTEDQVDIRGGDRLQKRQIHPFPYPTPSRSCTGSKIHEQQQKGRSKIQSSRRFDATVVRREDPDSSAQQSTTFTPEAPSYLTGLPSCSPDRANVFPFRKIGAMERPNYLTANTSQSQSVLVNGHGDKNDSPNECLKRTGYIPRSPGPFPWDLLPTLDSDPNPRDHRVQHENHPHTHTPESQVVKQSIQPQPHSKTSLEASVLLPQPQFFCHTQHHLPTSSRIDNTRNHSSLPRTVIDLYSKLSSEPERPRPLLLFPTSKPNPGLGVNSRSLSNVKQQLDTVQKCLEEARASRREKIAALRSCEIRGRMCVSGQEEAIWNERDELVLEVGRASEDIWDIEGEEGGLELLIDAVRGPRIKRRRVDDGQWGWAGESVEVDWEGMNIDGYGVAGRRVEGQAQGGGQREYGRVDGL